MGSMGGGAKIPDAEPVAAAVTTEDDETKAAGDAVRRRIRAQQGRQSTFIVPTSAGAKTHVGDA